MIYVLDTDHLSLMGQRESEHAPRIRGHIAQLPPEDLVVTTVVNYEEQMRGWMAALRPAKSFASEANVYRRLLSHLESFRRMIVLPFDDEAAQVASTLRLSRLRIGTMDLKIAAIALTNNAHPCLT